MKTRVQKQQGWKRPLLVTLLIAAGVTGSIAVPALQRDGVQVTYADGCEGGGAPPPHIEGCEPTPTPTPTIDPNH